MKILVLNCGSSSIKYQLLNMATNELLAKGDIDRIGQMKSGFIQKTAKDPKYRVVHEVPDHTAGINLILRALVSPEHGAIEKIEDIDAVGHRYAHGGEDFTESVLVNRKELKILEENVHLAPLHNPANLKGIMSMRSLLPDTPQVAVFDTSFHQTMPAKAYMYALPYEFYENSKIRRYGFHGTSHKFVSKRACEITNSDVENTKIITCHLGNGASIAAIKNGKSVDTSMGFTPDEGLIMGTRAGDVGVGTILHIAKQEEMTGEEVLNLINKKSGVLGISGISSDMRDIDNAAFNEKDERALLALDMYYYRIRKYIGAYAAAMGGVDQIVFTGGVGENGPETRKAICEDLEFLGVEIDDSKNDGVRGKDVLLSKDGARVKVVVCKTNEELVIAQDTLEIVQTINN